MYLLTNGWSLNHTSLAMSPEQCAISWEYWVLTSARAGHSRSKCLSSPKAPAWHTLQIRLCLGNCKWRPCSRASRPTSLSGNLQKGLGWTAGGSMVLGFMRRLLLLPEGSLHLDILQDNIADARQPLVCTNWAAGVDRQYRDLGMGSPFFSVRLALWTALIS